MKITSLDSLRKAAILLEDEFRKVIIGQQDIVRMLLACLFTSGHCLLIGVPGLGKTLLVRTLAKLLRLDFRRIQFTPDLMPSDVTGTEVIDTEEGPGTRRSFRFVRGPVFSNILLADEINRTPPKTQAALLEAMEERQVTVAGTTHKLPDVFFVIATQNPIEQEGTYPLPEAQLDRFMFALSINYPSLSEEEEIIESTTKKMDTKLESVLDESDLLTARDLIREVAISRQLIGFVARLVRATRPTDPASPEFVRKSIEFGAGPRAGQFIVLGAKALAAMDGRAQASFEDIRAVASSVLRHRLLIGFQGMAENIDSDVVTKKLFETVKLHP
ncbi:MAG: AAA family ATPase [Planctomycetes bacterium]|nr:AAA family ATPase [Planctomycetota bacterium]